MNYSAQEVKDAEKLADSALLSAMINHPKIRLMVNPDSLTGYGWALANTGGGCMALIQVLNNGYEVRAVDSCEGIPNANEPVNLGIFNEDGCQLASITEDSLILFGNEPLLPKWIDLYHAWLNANLISAYEPIEEVLMWPELTNQQRKELDALQLLHEVFLDEY